MGRENESSEKYPEYVPEVTPEKTPESYGMESGGGYLQGDHE